MQSCFYCAINNITLVEQKWKYLIIHDRWEFIYSRITGADTGVYSLLGDYACHLHRYFLPRGHHRKSQAVLPWLPNLTRKCLHK